MFTGPQISIEDLAKRHNVIKATGFNRWIFTGKDQDILSFIAEYKDGLTKYWGEIIHPEPDFCWIK